MKIDIFNAEEKYDILYTDPPWQQGRGGMCLSDVRNILPTGKETGTLRKGGA